MSSLRHKISFGTLITLGVGFLVLAYQGRVDLKQRIRQAEDHGEQVARTLAEASVIPIQNFQFQAVLELAEQAKSASSLVVYSVVQLQANTELIPPERYFPSVASAAVPQDPRLIWVSCPISAQLPFSPSPPNSGGGNAFGLKNPCQFGPTPPPSKLHCRASNPIGPKSIEIPETPICPPERLGRVDIALDLDPVYAQVQATGIRLGSVYAAIVVTAFLLLNLLITEQILTPIRRLFHSTRKIRMGEFVDSGIARQDSELGQLGREFDQMSQALQQRTETLEAENRWLQTSNQELERLAHQDGLTELANRRHFDGFLEQQWRTLQREQQPLSVLLCDVDFFKRYNDTYSHQAGDRCLKAVAQSIQSALQRSADLAARYGGEELVVVMPNTDREGALQVAQRIQTALADQQIPHAGSTVSPYVTLSIGAATCIPRSSLAPEQLIAAADQGLYRAKGQGRNQVVWQEMPAGI